MPTVPEGYVVQTSSFEDDLEIYRHFLRSKAKLNHDAVVKTYRDTELDPLDRDMSVSLAGMFNQPFAVMQVVQETGIAGKKVSYIVNAGVRNDWFARPAVPIQ